jgi:hypothetical protein
MLEEDLNTGRFPVTVSDPRIPSTVDAEPTFGSLTSAWHG